MATRRRIFSCARGAAPLALVPLPLRFVDRVEGQRRYDLIGGSYGFRRPPCQGEQW